MPLLIGDGVGLLPYLPFHPLDNVWDFAFEGDPNIVEVYVGYLRKKIDTAFGVTSVETVRGMGYRLMPVRSTGQGPGAA